MCQVKHCTMKAMFGADDKVFAKVRGYPYWPARIVGPIDESAPLSKLKYEIIFYGTGEKAVVKGDDVQPFLKKRLELGKPRKQKAFNDAMAEIESEFSPEELAKGDTDQEGITERIRKLSGRPKKSLLETPEPDPVKPSSSENKPKSRKRSSVPDEDSPLDTTIRSGRKIKSKKQSVDDTASPTQTPRSTVKRSQKYNLEDSLEFELRGNKVGIPLNLNRPAINCPKSSMEWQELVLAKACSLRDSVSGGNLSLDEAVQEMGEYTRRLGSEKRNEYRENDRQFRELKIEGRLLQLDVKIKTCLTLARAKPADACKHIDEVGSLPLSALMLKKHPQIVETFKRLTRYVGNSSAWSMSTEKKEEFAVEALTVRSKAEAVLDKLMNLLGVTDHQSFYIQFSDRLRRFSRATENLTQEQFFSLTTDPTPD